MTYNFLTNPLTLRALYYTAMARGFLRYRNPYRRQAWKHRVDFYNRAWREASEELGAASRMLGGGFMEISSGPFRTIVNDNSSAIDDPVTLSLLSDKAITYNLLEENALPVPRHAEFSLKKINAGLEFLRLIETSGGPKFGCVVKPVRGTGGGRGITTGIRTRSHLVRAAASAAIYCDDLLIEEQVPGDNYRLLYLDGELIDAFVRRPPTVIGDGRSTISQLVSAANQERIRQKAARSQVLLTIDIDMQRTLGGQSLSLSSVPVEGKRVILKTVVNENCGDDNSTVTHLLSAALIEEGAKAARATGIRLGGVDIITQDASIPLAESGGVVLEVNAPPNFYYHYHKSDGVFPVAVHVLRRLMEGTSTINPLVNQHT